MDFKKNYKIINSIFIVFTMMLVFILGFGAGYSMYKEHCKEYLGVVLEKEYLPEEIVEENGKMERYDEQYNLILRDNSDERICISVDKDRFKQIEVGDLVRR